MSRSKWLVWTFVTVVSVAVIFQIFFRYEIRETPSGNLVQVDRLTGREEVVEFSSVDQPRRRDNVW